MACPNFIFGPSAVPPNSWPWGVAAGLISTRAAEFSQCFGMQPGAVVRKAAEGDQPERWRAGQRIHRRRDRDPRRPIGGETIDTGGNRGKSHRSEVVGLAQLDGAAIDRPQPLFFALVSAVRAGATAW